MATWKANNYQNSGLSKSQYLAKQSAPKRAPAKNSFSSPQPQQSSGFTTFDSFGNGMSTNQAPQSAGDAFIQRAFGTPKQNIISDIFQNAKTSNKNLASSSTRPSSPKTSSNSTSSNRSLAQTAFNKSMGIKTAEAASPKPITEGGVKGAIKSGVSGIINFRNQANDFARSKGIDTAFNTDWGISELLGIPSESIVPESQQMNPDYKPSFNPYDVIGRVGANDVSTLTDIINGKTVNFTEPYQSTPKTIDRTTTNTEEDRPNNKPTPRQVSNPFVAPNPFISPQQEPVRQAPQFDFTPEQQRQGGTQRQFAGNGVFSNGQFNNGQGNYGFQGAATGTVQDANQINPIDDLLTLLGVKPMEAQAAETQNFAPQSMQSFGQPQPNIFNQIPANSTGYSAKNGGMSSMFGTDTAPTFEKKQPTTRTQMEGAGNGPTQQYAQPSSNALSLTQQQEQGYSAQEKAQKKATDELIRSIKKQYGSQIKDLNTNYDTQQKTGLSELDKAKQADLMQLSGLFNFSANQSPDSEQRIQYQGRAQDQANTNVTNFLAKLMAAKNSDLTGINANQNKDISSAKSSLQTALASIAENRGKTQLDIAKMIDAARKSGSTQKNASFTPMGVAADGKTPIFYDNVNHKYVTDLPQGTQKAADPFAAWMSQNQPQSQGGSWEIDPQTGQRVWVTD